MNSNRYGVSIYAKILLDSSATVFSQRAALFELERLVKAEKEYMDRPKTASECVGYEPTTCAEVRQQTTAEWVGSLTEFSKFTSQCQNLLEEIKNSSGNALHYAVQRLEMAVIGRQNKLCAEAKERAAALTRAVSVSELEVCLEEFLQGRDRDRKALSEGAVWETSSSLERKKREDADFSYLFRNFMRHKLKLPTL